MQCRKKGRHVTFEVIDSVLTRTLSFTDGHGYTHRCTFETFKQVAHTLDEPGDLGVTLNPLAELIDAPLTQVNVALEFLKERGCMVTRGRRNYPSSNVLFEDAMTEYFYLAKAK